MTEAFVTLITGGSGGIRAAAPGGRWAISSLNPLGGHLASSLALTEHAKETAR